MQQPFIANILFSISCEGIFTEQYEEQLRLLFAADHDEAVRAAKVIAADEEGDFKDRHQRTISWKYVAVKDIVPVNLDQGALLHSSIKETEPVGLEF